MLAKTLGFSGVFAFTTLRPGVPKEEKTRISGGISGRDFEGQFSSRTPATRATRTPADRVLHSPRKNPTSVPGFPCPSFLTPLSLVPHSLVPRSSLNRSSLNRSSLNRSSFLALPAADGFSRHGSHRCCGKTGGGLRFQRNGRGRSLFAAADISISLTRHRIQQLQMRRAAGQHRVRQNSLSRLVHAKTAACCQMTGR